MKRYDPRFYQIAILTSVMVYGIVGLDLEIHYGQALAIIFTVFLAQYVSGKLAKLPNFDPRSPLISGLSLCLLLRTNSMMFTLLAAVITIGSKFIIRFKGKHVFNPTNFGLVTMMALTNRVWVSPGQWGSTAFWGFLLACLGFLVVNRAARCDITIAFLGFYVVFIFGRGLWLGDPLSIPFHHIQNGAFLIFTFFMISDPKSTPNSRSGRILFAFLVAGAALFIQFALYRPNGLLWSLAVMSVFTPLIDFLFPGSRYVWNHPIVIPHPLTQGVKNEKTLQTNTNVPMCGITC